MATPQYLGRTALRLTRWAWLAGLVLSALTVTGGSDLFWMGMLLLLGCSALLVAVPGVVFLVYSVRPDAGVPPTLRRAAIEAGACNVALGAIMAGAGLSSAWRVPGVAVLLFGAAVIVRALRARAQDEGPMLRHAGSTVAGLLSFVILLILIPKFSGMPSSRAFETGMKSDLNGLVVAEELYHEAHHRYATLAELGDSYRPMWPDVTIVVAADTGRYVGRATHPRARRACLVWAGAPRPDDIGDAPEGKPTCR